MGAPKRPLQGDPAWWQLPLLLALSISYESLFIWNGLNLLDEGWPLYAAMRLHAGGQLYGDVFWVFPPGALLPAWLGYALDPPGLVATRMINAGFNVALCSAIYALGRRLMTPAYAFLGAALLAVAAPHSHIMQLLFGYRYLVFSALALLCFSRGLRSGQKRWLVLAGCFSGVALVFRLTPAFAVCAGIAVGILASGRDWRRWVGDGLLFSSGFIAVAAPAILYFGYSAGLETLWREVVVRPLVMTELQSMPAPALYLPTTFDRWHIERAFAVLEFRIYPLLYLGYASVLAFRWVSAVRAGKAFDEALLLATVVWGGVYFLRSIGRTDVFHLESAIPPVCLLIARLAQPRPSRRSLRKAILGVAVIFSAWVLLKEVDLYAMPGARGETPLAALGGEIRMHTEMAGVVDPLVQALRRLSEPGDILLDLSAAPVIHVLTGLPGVGHSDLLMPGTLMNAEEESVYLERIASAPPALVLAPRVAFDGMPGRAVWETAPRIVQWVSGHFVRRTELRDYVVLVPRAAEVPRGTEASGTPLPEP
jgi:hypothetical protein